MRRYVCLYLLMTLAGVLNTTIRTFVDSDSQEFLLSLLDSILFSLGGMALAKMLWRKKDGTKSEFAGWPHTSKVFFGIALSLFLGMYIGTLFSIPSF